MQVHIYHVNITTNEHYRSYHAGANASEMTRLSAWLAAPTVPVSVGENCLCICRQRSSKMLDVLIQQQQDDVIHDIRHIVICTHSRRKVVAWAAIAAVGVPPEVPFAVSRIIEAGGDKPQLEHFERDLAWAFVAKEKHG